MSFAPRLARRLAAEALGTCLLLAIVVGSGIMGERLAAGNTAIALLANALATGAGLVALILMLGHVSGAHFNPLVTLAETIEGRLGAADALAYGAVQLVAAIAGVLLAHLMFEAPLVEMSQHARAGAAQMASEAVATFGLLLVIAGCARNRPAAIPFAVGAWITAAYWFTASTSFANPVVTIARSLTDTFAGVRPADVPGFIAAQAIGAVAAIALGRWLYRGDVEPR